MNRTSVGSTARSAQKLNGPILPLLLLLAVSVSFRTAAQSNTNDHSNRWLLVVDTSKGMQRRSESVQHVAGALVLSGMNGQMRKGDTLGIWTFNEGLFTGQFKLQQWGVDSSEVVAGRVLGFLGGQTFERASRIEEALPQIQRLISHSAYITVIIVSDGSGQMTGTPFDDKINASYKSWQKEQAKSQMPIVTLLRAAQGKITDYAVTTPPWPLDMPPLPAELLRKTDVVKTQRVAAPLIVSGKKPDAGTQAVAAVTAPASNSVTPQLVAQAPVAGEVVPAPAVVETSAVAVVTEPVVENPPPATPEKTVAVAKLDPAPPASTEVTKAPASSAAKTEIPTVQAEVVPKWKGMLKGKNVWILGGSVAVIFFALLFLRARRSRNSEPISLITRSLDREKE